MAGVADTFQTASFNGIEFPYAERSIKCSLRHHTHEYPHAPGGDDEPLGRKLYEFGFTCDFDTGFEGRFPGIYPNTLILLFATFGEETTADLVIPGFATFRARCIDWDTRKVSRIRSGEKVTFKFIEVLAEIVNVQNFTTAPQAMPALATQLTTAVTALSTAPLNGLPSNAIPKLSDLDTINGLVTSIAALPTNSPAISVQASALLGACQAYDVLPFLRYPRSYAAADALHEVYLASLKVLKDALLKNRAIDVFVTDVPGMSISQVATRLYGSTARTGELMQLNNLVDALNLPPGTSIRYYAS